jgi:outer membrane protein OmpA-like peptidoglycan-associated protein
LYQHGGGDDLFDPNCGVDGSMAFRKRPGQTQTGLVRVDQETNETIDALLYDFDIDDDELKVRHKQHLAHAMQFMADRLQERKQGLKPGERAWTVSIDGFASRTGTAEHNKILSAMREQAVAAYFNYYLDLKPGLKEAVEINTKYHGFTDTTVPGENPLGRSVRVVVHRPGVPPPPKPPEPVASPRNFFCSDASKDVVNVLDRFFSFEPPIPIFSVSDCVSKVLKRLEISGSKIENLVIGGHGASGFQSMGSGREWDNTGAKSLQVDPANSNQLLGQAAKAMALLNGKFTSNGVVSLMGCRVARGGEGLQLLKVVSKTVGANVQASIARQRPLIPGWEGDVYRCRDNNCWIQQPGIIHDW